MSKETLSIQIKNMVCPRCIMAVSDLLQQLQINYQEVGLGTVLLADQLSASQTEALASGLKDLGFELLSSRNAKLIAQLKQLIIEKIHHQEEEMTANWSDFLSAKLGHTYSVLTKLFSATEGITIEKYILKQKIEMVKEYLIYDERSLSEIAHQLNYSSVAYLSAQFKKETGMTPTQFKQLDRPKRSGIDEL
ncbi:AraC family transcriptional regulator [Persicobacter psychrovividus]